MLAMQHRRGSAAGGALTRLGAGDSDRGSSKTTTIL
jgi:hypothetical protein